MPTARRLFTVVCRITWTRHNRCTGSTIQCQTHPILHTGIDEMAAFHITTMRGVQARGPYLLGGLCAGGLIGFEMARQLQAAGEQVVMVALMDAADVDAREKTLRGTKERLARLSSTLAQEKGRSFARRVAGSCA